MEVLGDDRRLSIMGGLQESLADPRNVIETRLLTAEKVEQALPRTGTQAEAGWTARGAPEPRGVSKTKSSRNAGMSKRSAKQAS